MEKSKIKVLFLITKGNFGGAQRYVYNLASHLPKEKFEPIVACGKGDSLQAKLSEKAIRSITLESSQRDINILKDFKAFLEIKKIIRTEEPHILHVNSSKAGGLGALAGRMLGVKKIIFTSHGWAFNENRGAFQKFLIYFLHWITVILSHQTIAVSYKTARDIAWMPFIKHKIKVVHNGLDDFKPLSKKEASETLIRPDKDTMVLFSISELHKNKGLDVAIRGISQLPSAYKERIIYYIAGEGEERSSLEKIIFESGLSNHVHLLGYAENAKKMLSGADVFLFPSRNENLPFAVLEAGYVELPIIATSVGGIPEIIEDMKNGILIHPNNSKEIAEAIIYAFEHKEKCKEFGEEIKKTVTNFFNLDKMLSETIKIYQENQIC